MRRASKARVSPDTRPQPVPRRAGRQPIGQGGSEVVRIERKHLADAFVGVAHSPSFNGLAESTRKRHFSRARCKK
jgi:hypothetical protein